MTNPLLSTWDTPFEIAPFDQIKDSDFAPALEEALAAHQAQIDAIATSQEAPTFANVIEALETPCRELEQVLSVFYSVAGADSNPEREALQRAFSPKLAAHFSAITANKALYARVKAVWDQRDTLDLSEEQARVLMLTHRGFVRGGAALEGADDTRMQEIKSRLATLGTEFTQNLLADERSWYMELSEEDLSGLPQFVVDAARAAGKGRAKACVSGRWHGAYLAREPRHARCVRTSFAVATYLPSAVCASASKPALLRTCARTTSGTSKGEARYSPSASAYEATSRNDARVLARACSSVETRTCDPSEPGANSRPSESIELAPAPARLSGVRRRGETPTRRPPSMRTSMCHSSPMSERKMTVDADGSEMSHRHAESSASVAFWRVRSSMKRLPTGRSTLPRNCVAISTSSASPSASPFVRILLPASMEVPFKVEN